jgi:hypothetical protein
MKMDKALAMAPPEFDKSSRFSPEVRGFRTESAFIFY